MKYKVLKPFVDLGGYMWTNELDYSYSIEDVPRLMLDTLLEEGFIEEVEDEDGEIEQRLDILSDKIAEIQDEYIQLRKEVRKGKV